MGRTFPQDSATSQQMPPPLAEYPDGSPGFHIFLSHVWRHAQDQVATIKYMLLSRYPGVRAFLDVENLDHVTRRRCSSDTVTP